MGDIKAQYSTLADDHFPATMTITLGETTLTYRKRMWKLPAGNGGTEEKGLRYGENPGQEAALYQLTGGNLSLGKVELIRPGQGIISALSEADMLQSGKHPGKTNLTDVDNALNILRYIKEQPAAAIMKHNNPSGVALGANIDNAYERAFMADMVAAFGGAAVLNRPVNKSTAQMMGELYLEVVAAPDYEEGCLDILSKWKNLRILRIPALERIYEYRDMRFLDIKNLMDGGLIVQISSLNSIRSPEDFLPAQARRQNILYTINRRPSEEELKDGVLGWAVEQAVTSNSVLFVKNGCTVSVGAGQQDRVGVAQLAVERAYEKYMNRLAWHYSRLNLNELKRAVAEGRQRGYLLNQIEEETTKVKAGLTGSVMVSDAFFPFRDGAEIGLEQGAGLIVQPGGAIRDWEIIQACNEAGAAMVFTGQRAFKH
ncbi:MAG: IMP cyclohydrolase [Desulfarculales bacterium]|jgi:phosphoribosylaminoimidazolecarboxamide formyltransferase/IMP cyclohydrolase|nr:IMP cyclohydrolase [Desulfarculales bacterium]